MLGEDDRAILSKDLGLSVETIRDLSANGILSEAPVLGAASEV